MPAVKESFVQTDLLPPPPSYAKGRRRLSKSSTKSPSSRKRRRENGISDIRRDLVGANLRDTVASMMNPQKGPRALPTELLYDAKGLQLFETITYLPEYYPTNFEIELLQQASIEIAQKIPDNSMVVELGSGNLRKVCLLLNAFESLHKKIDYYALDLSMAELERSLGELPHFQYVSCHGLRGTYDDGREWLKHASRHSRPKCIMHLGSSIGNFHRQHAADFLAGFAELLRPDDSMIVGVDSCSDPNKVYHAYNDSQGVTHDFILNGLSHANELFEKDVFNLPDWKVIGEYVYDDEGGRHQAFVSPVRETLALGHRIMPGERIKIEQSLKYSQFGVDKLWRAAGLEQIRLWSKDEQYGLHLLQKAALPMSRFPPIYAADPLPSIPEWRALWQAWDTVTQEMLPRSSLLDRPITLRNPFLFYVGHIPCFLDILLSKGTGAPGTPPAAFQAIFERGIDPDVDNPEECHAHSETPEKWPERDDILEYQGDVRLRLLGYYNDGRVYEEPGWLRRAVWTAFEHEVMHLETLLYMMLQSDKALPPPVAPRPDFEAMAIKAQEERVPNEWFDIPEQTISVGLDDPEDTFDLDRPFGWDNEKPERMETVHAFQAKGRAITNEEYANYLEATQGVKMPSSWVKLNVNGSANASDGTDGKRPFIQDVAVRTVYGLLPLKLALDWPVFASYDELSKCAAWMGGRIPTAAEARSIYAHVEKLKLKNLGGICAVANKVQEPSLPLYVDLIDENVGFKHWHPVSISSRGNKLAGRAGLGGVWEWTSSPLTKHEGFEPMTLYPQYTADFFDGKHNIVLGGSWATHPRVAGRTSFVNWYQKNYDYAWVGARLVRDSDK